MLRYCIDTARLRAAIRTQGYPSLAAFAQARGLSRATLQSYVRGQTPLSAAFYALADALRLDPLSLLVPTKASAADPPHREILPIVQTLCRRHPRVAVALFGSRANATARPYSDWDLGITGGHEGLSAIEYLRAKQCVDDLAEDLPRKVDLIHLDAAPSWFLTETTYQPVFLGGAPESWIYFLGVLHGAQKSA